MSDAEQPTRLKRASKGFVWAGLLLATLLAIFVLVPFGASGGMSATTPTTSSAPDHAPESTSPETWVLSSTVVTSTPADYAPDTSQVEADHSRADTHRSTPLIIQVPVDGPTTHLTTQSTTVPSSDASSTTTSSGAGTPTTTDAGDPTCAETGTGTETEPAPTEDEAALPDDVGPSGGYDNPILDPANCED